MRALSSAAHRALTPGREGPRHERTPGRTPGPRRRVALYSHDTQGLGHVRRNIEVARALVAERPHTDVLLLTGAAEHATAVPDHAAALADVRRLASAHRADPGRRAVLHRDLHDKQLLLDGGEVGLLDLDLLAAGEPALDLANLLVHLELRARQGVLTVAAAARAARGVLSGYRPPPEVRAGLPVHARLTRLRLAAVYAFRPGGAAAARHLPTHPLLEELPR